MIYNPQDWYWQITGVGIYGSARRGLVTAPETDAAYLAFKANAGPGSIAADTASLDEVLVGAGVPASGLTPPGKPQLLAYAMAKVQALLAASRPYTVAGVAGTIACDSGPSAGDVGEALQWGSIPDQTGTLEWLDNTYADFSLTPAEAVAFATTVGDYKISVYAVSTPSAVQIKAGAITTTAQIDALPWPV